MKWRGETERQVVFNKYGRLRGARTTRSDRNSVRGQCLEQSSKCQSSWRQLNADAHCQGNIHVLLYCIQRKLLSAGQVEYYNR